MAGNYNTWGGKNNRWGNRNRKGGNNDRTYHYEPNKLFSIFIGGVFLFALGSFGLNALSDAISGVKEVKEVANTTKNIVENQAAPGDYTDTLVINPYNLEIDSEDVSDMITYVYENLNKTSDNIIVLDYTKVKDLESFKKNVIERLDGHKEVITFGITSGDTSLSKEEAQNSIDNIKEMVSDNLELLADTNYTEVNTGGITKESVSTGHSSFLITITFSN